MRTALVIGLSALALVGGLGPSEARFKMRLPAHVGSAQVGSAHSSHAAPSAGLRGAAARTVAAAAAAPLAVQTAEALGPDETGDIGFLRRSEPVAAPPAKKEAPSWCANGQIAGSGTGFCIIN